MRRSPLVAMAASVIIAACTTLVSDPPEGTGGRGAGGGATDRIDCPAGTADCGDGDCLPLDSEEHCGACDVECTAHNGAAACVAGACQITCDPGFADCNGDPRDGCEVGLLTDAANCQACGAACDETDCLEGSCVSILAAATAAFVGADSLLTIGADLYFATPGVDAHGEIARVPQAGGLLTPLLAPGVSFWPITMRANGSALFYGDVMRAGLFTFQLPSGPEVTLVPSTSSLRVLDVDGSNVWLTDGATIVRTTIAFGDSSTIATGLVGVSQGRLAHGSLYVTVLGPAVPGVDQSGLDYTGHPSGSLLRVTGDAVETIAQGLDTPTAIVADAEAIYWAESGSITTYATSDTDFNAGTLGRVVRAAPDGSSRTTLADHLVQPVSLAVDASHLYIASAGTVGGNDPNGPYESDGSVDRVPKIGGPLEPFFPSIDARSIALAEDRVFFSSWIRSVVLAKKK